MTQGIHMSVVKSLRVVDDSGNDAVVIDGTGMKIRAPSGNMNPWPPTQAGHAGEMLTTNGLRATWTSNTVGKSLTLDASASEQSSIFFQENGVSKWQLLRQVGNTFVLYDAVNAQTLWTSIAGSKALSITPIAASAMQGIYIEQAGPLSGSQGTQLNYNQILIGNDQANTGASSNYTNALLVTLNTGGGNSQGSKAAIFGTVNVTAAQNMSFAAGDNVGVYGIATGFATAGGTDTASGARGSLFGLASGATLLTGATNYFVISGGELDIGINTGGSSRHRLGWSMVGIGDLPAADLDIAFEVSSAGQPWKTGLGFTSLHSGGTVGPVTTTGTLIGTDGIAMTVAHGIDLSAYSFTSDFLKGPSFNVAGTGIVTSPAYRTSTALITATNGSATAAFTANMVAATGGPTTAAQNGWVKMQDSAGATIWIPVWK